MNPYHKLFDSPAVLEGQEHTAECAVDMGVPWHIDTERYRVLGRGNTIRERLNMERDYG